MVRDIQRVPFLGLQGLSHLFSFTFTLRWQLMLWSTEEQVCVLFVLLEQYVKGFLRCLPRVGASAVVHCTNTHFCMAISAHSDNIQLPTIVPEVLEKGGM